jgi:hypothetical protein
MATGATADVNGVEATLFKDTDPPIYLMPDGRFAMKWAGIWKVKSSMAPLLKMLNRFQTPIKMMAVDRLDEPSTYTGRKVDVIEALSWERGIIGLKDGKRKKDRYERWNVYDAKVEKELNDLYAQVQKLEKEHCKAFAALVKKHQQICKRMKPVTESSFRNLVLGLDEIRKRPSEAGGSNGTA